MQNYQKNYVGIDVSKPHFDASLLVVINHQKQEMISSQFANDAAGLKAFLQWLKASGVTQDENTLIVMENTGIYHRGLWKFCCDNHLTIHIGNAAQIKWSFGIARGKNDAIDSKRICLYAYRHADELQATPALNPACLRLNDLITARNKLIKQKNSILVYLKELKISNDAATQQIMENSFKASIEGIKTSLKELSDQIRKILKEDAEISKNYKLMISVPGIGIYTAAYIICCTSNFATRISGKQLASYAGVVPFDYSSGISIKGKKRVHKMANKDLKKLLYLCANTAINHYPEFKDYYDRKMEEGKHYLTIINAIKNKLLLRVVSVVNNQKTYESKHQLVV